MKDMNDMKSPNISPQNPIAVANYVIDYTLKNKHPITNLHLQKVLFFLQGYFLYTYNVPLMSGNFAKWKYGPVQREVYQTFKFNGSEPISELGTEIYLNNNEFSTKEPILEKERLPDPNCFNKLIYSLIQKSASNLINLTHRDKSWKEYEKKIMQHSSLEYKNDEIKSCYENNRTEFNDQQ